MSNCSNLTTRKKRGISLSSISQNKSFVEHHTTVQSSFIRQPRPSSISYVYQRPMHLTQQISTHTSTISTHKTIPRKITFKYTNKKQFEPQRINPINISPLIECTNQIRYLIGPHSSRIKTDNCETIVQSRHLNVAQSNYVSPYKCLITPMQNTITPNKVSQSKQKLNLNFLPLNSQLSKINQFKMQDSHSEANYQAVNNKKDPVSQTIFRQNLCITQAVQIKQNKNVQSVHKTQTKQNQDSDVLKQKNLNNVFSQKVQEKSAKKQKVKGRMNHLRIKQVQKRLQQIIKVCDNSLC